MKFQQKLSIPQKKAIKKQKLKFALAIAPPPDLTVSEWADQNRVLSSESSAEAGKWRTSRAEYQRGIQDAFSEIGITEVAVMTSAQIGKALDVSTPIPTPDGWTLMGNLSVGDIVFDEHGKQCEVTFCSKVMHDRECFNVLFSDNSNIVADGEHVWTVLDSKWGGKKDKKDLTTSEMFDGLLDNGRNRYSIPVQGSLVCDARDLPINPYWLGVWLGDGHSYSSTISVGDEDLEEMVSNLSAIDSQFGVVADGSCHSIQYRIKHMTRCKRGHVRDDGYCRECHRQTSKSNMHKHLGDRRDPVINPSMYYRLNDLGVFKNKHIPAAYLRSSATQRQELLMGLMDTDGHVTVKGACEYVTTCEALAAGIGELLSSLGLKYSLRKKQPRTKYKGVMVDGAVAWCFNFKAYSDFPIFKLTRKKARQKTIGQKTREGQTKSRFITAINEVDSVPVKCIQVNSESHLYLAGSTMIPTHNTEILNNIVGYHIDQDPSPILVLQPTIDMAQTWSKDRLAPMLRDTPCLKGRVKDSRARDSGNTILHKSFAGGHITMAGANSPASLASRPIRINLNDEVDRFPISAGTEGDPVNLAKKRTTTYFNRVIGNFSTPTIKGASRIEDLYELSDKRRYYVPCPECLEFQTLKWEFVKWEDPKEPYYLCECCGSMLGDGDLIHAVRKGKWIATAEFNGRAGFHLNELYSPFVSLAETVKAFLEAKKKPDTLRVWINTSLGETWEDKGETVDGEGLLTRRELYDADSVPEGVLLITAGVDVQADRIEVECVGWGAGEESWGIDYSIIRGDPDQKEIWNELDEYLLRKFTTEDGRELMVEATCVDSGFKTDRVYDFTLPRKRRRVWSIKGMAGSGRPIWPKRNSKVKNKNVVMFLLGIDTAKEIIYSRLRTIQEHGAGYMHFPMDYDEEYFAQLTAEGVRIKHKLGRPYREWYQKRSRNEALDIRVYAMAAYLGRGVDLDKRAQIVTRTPEPEAAPLQRPIRQRTQRQQKSFVGGWK